MKSVWSFVVVFALFAMVACGGGNSSSSSSSSTVSISPTTANVAINTTQQFTATVSGSATASVTWSVNSVAGGNFTVGTITTTGLYTAPAVIPNPSTVTITATSLSDASQTASAKVTVTSGTALSLTISPSSASVFTGQTQQFTANVTPNVNGTVTWEVNSTVGGNSTVGTINSAGLYTAPSAVPNPASVTITAVSQADTTKTATASVTVVLGTTLVVSPNVVTVPGGAQQTFTATANSAPANVTWSLNCQSTATGACGSITTAGVYTAPPTPPPGATVTLTATSVNGSALPTSAAITIQFANGSLNGQFAFTFAGHNAGTAFVSAGSVKFDGNGNVTGGTEDINGAAVSNPSITGGSYHVGSDGRGNATVQTASGSETWQFVIVNAARIFASRFEVGSITGSGTLDLQQPSQFALGSVKGPYTFSLADGTTASQTVAGALSADGGGNISQGLLDSSGGGKTLTAQPLTGSYTAPDSNGRGTLTLVSGLGTQKLAFYVIDGTRSALIETDPGQAWSGYLTQQPAGPFVTSSLAGPFAFVVAGTATQGPLGTGGIFTSDGAGNITSGTADQNLNGNATGSAGLPLTGTYQLADATTGRTTASFNINGAVVQYVLYPANGGSWNTIEIDGTNVAAGVVRAQTQAAFSASTLRGTFGFTLAGQDFVFSPGGEDITGLLAPNGGSVITGTADINANGQLSRAAAVQGSYIFATTSGRATASLNTPSGGFQSATVVLYLVDASNALLLETDSNRVLVGAMQKQ